MTLECSLDEIGSVVQEILKRDNLVILLSGDLASGKTTLVSECAKALHIKEDVTSPTFSLQQIYGEKFFHYDIYNNGVENFLELGLLEDLEKEGYHFIEWADKKLENLLQSAGIKYMKIDIEKSSANTRLYRIDDAQA